MKLYKYMKPQHLNAFFKSGEIKLGSLLHYQNEERFGSTVGDRKEGINATQMRFENGRAVLLSGDTKEAFLLRKWMGLNQGEIPLGFEVVFQPDTNLLHQEISENLYIFCCSTRFNSEQMRKYGGSCMEIAFPVHFFRQLSLTLGKQKKVKFLGAGPMFYGEKTLNYHKEHKISPAWIKEKDRFSDYEYRAAWAAVDESEMEEYLIMNVKSARKFCRQFYS